MRVPELHAMLEDVPVEYCMVMLASLPISVYAAPIFT